MLSKLKSKVELLLTPLIDALIRLNMKPIHCTLLGFVLTVLSVALLVAGTSLLLVAAVFLSGTVMDMVDGMLARRSRSQSSRGSFLDSVADRYEESIFLLALAYCGLCSYVAAICALIGSYMTSYARAKAESLGMKKMGFIIFERAERVLLLAAGLIAAYVVGRAEVVEYTVLALAVASNISALRRIVFVVRNLS